MQAEALPVVAALATNLAAWQSPAGAFWSTITSRDRTETDWNGFVTALVLREMRHLPSTPALARIQAQALNFLADCASTRLPGAFSFWPTSGRPGWASQVPEDADDTAIMTLELARAGRLSRTELLRIVCHTLIPYRVSAVATPIPTWIQPGVFLTWLSDHPHHPNLVDCCVNTNAIALMAYADATHLPGYQAACQLIEQGISWVGSSASRLHYLTPFYPNPNEFYFALVHAVECGAPLHHCVEALASLLLDEITQFDSPVCSSAYHSVVWHCPALVEVRRVAYQQSC